MLITKRLVLKPYDDADEERMIDLLTNAAIKETFMIPDFTSKEDAVSMFKKLRQWSISDDHYELGIYRQDVLIGFVNDVAIEPDSIEIGFAIHPDHHNQGYATEVLSSVIIDLMLRGFSKVIAGAFETNVASRKVMEKCGMVRMARETDIYYNGRQQHCIYYSIMADSNSHQRKE